MKPCPTKSDCPCEGNPVGNFSSEAPDQDVFLGFNSGTIAKRPSPGDKWDNPDGFYYCADGTSQLSADLCAAAGAVDNGVDGGGPGGDGVAADAGNRDPGTLYSNTEQSCTVPCPNGGQFTYTIPAGKVRDLSPILVDRIAASLACKQANKFIICIGPLDNVTGTVGTGYFGTVKLTGNFAPYKWTATTPLPAGLVLDDESGGDSTLSKTVGIIGTPTASGAQSFTLRATDKQGNFAERNFTITVAAIPVTLAAYWTFDKPGEPFASGALPPISWGWTDQVGNYEIDAFTFLGSGAVSGAGKIANGAINPGDLINPAFQAGITIGQPLPGFDPAKKGVSLFGWFKYNSFAANGDEAPMLLIFLVDIGGTPAIGLGVHYTAGPASLFWESNDTLIAGTFAAGAWIFVAYTYDAVTGIEKAYLNGVLVGAQASTIFTSASQPDFRAAESHSQVIRGDEIGYMNDHVLTQAQITALYNSGNGLTWPAVNSV